MAKVSLSTELPVSARTVWDVIGGFNNLTRWHPAIAKRSRWEPLVIERLRSYGAGNRQRGRGEEDPEGLELQAPTWRLHLVGQIRNESGQKVPGSGNLQGDEVVWTRATATM